MAGATAPLLLVLLPLPLLLLSAIHASPESSLLSRSLSLPKRYMLDEMPPAKTNHSRNATSAAAQAPSPPPHKTHHKKHKHRVRNWVLGFVAGSLAGAASGLVISIISRLVLNFIRGRYKNPASPSIFFPTIIKSKKDLEFLNDPEALSSLEFIGRGACGEVYRAELPTNPGKLIAIKRIMKRSLDGEGPAEADNSHALDKWMRQIRSEILTVGHIRHRNLLPLLAHVVRPDSHFLIYEYMKNGSLHDALKRVQDGAAELPWPARFNILKGIAAGLEYLHIHHKAHIIHRDLKPANILLDDGLEARIADFGLAKEIPDADTHMTASNVAGTVGYIAPEYHQTSKFTAKCDVYSFGVIMAVVVTGRFPSDDFFQETDEMSLVKWVRNAVGSGGEAAGTSAIDARLRGGGGEEEMLLVLRIACFCTVDDPKDRPNSKDVRLMLAQVG